MGERTLLLANPTSKISANLLKWHEFKLGLKSLPTMFSLIFFVAHKTLFQSALCRNCYCRECLFYHLRRCSNRSSAAARKSLRARVKSLARLQFDFWTCGCLTKCRGRDHDVNNQVNFNGFSTTWLFEECIDEPVILELLQLPVSMISNLFILKLWNEYWDKCQSKCLNSINFLLNW